MDYFPLPPQFAGVGVADQLSDEEGYFSFEGATCYGRRGGGPSSSHLNANLPDASSAVDHRGGRVYLPFNLTEVLANLRQERYVQQSDGYFERIVSSKIVRGAYYFLRPVLPVAVRKHLQKASLNGWQRIPFPRWPVDVTVER